MERDPKSPDPSLPGGRALERLRQFERERGLEQAPVTLPENADDPLPAGGGAGTENEPARPAAAPPECEPRE